MSVLSVVPPPKLRAGPAMPGSDPGRPGASLNAFAGSPAYGIQQLRDDTGRFVFPPGGSDGQELFSGDDNGPVKKAHGNRPATPVRP